MGETKQKTSAIHPKVAASLLAGALTVVLAFIVQSIWNVEIPADVAAAITTLISFAAGYFKVAE